MNIPSISFQHKQNNINNLKAPSFKATFPVVHWISETNGSAAPEFDLEIVQQLQRKLVRLINKVSKNPKYKNIQHQLFNIPSDSEMLLPAEVRIYKHLKSCDLDFRRNPKIRSFYDRTTNNNSARPVAFAITGSDIDIFENTLAKNIGKEKKEARQTLGTPYSEKAKAAIEKYCNSGLKFVLSPQRRIYDYSGQPYILHTHFVKRRDKNGELKGYDLINAKFLPQKNNR